MEIDLDSSVICLDESPVPLPRQEPRLNAVHRPGRTCPSCERRRAKPKKTPRQTVDLTPIEVIDLSNTLNDASCQCPNTARCQNQFPGECGVCLEPLSNVDAMSATICGHIFCRNCIMRVITETGQCPKCRKALRNTKDIISLYP